MAVEQGGAIVGGVGGSSGLGSLGAALGSAGGPLGSLGGAVILSIAGSWLGGDLGASWNAEVLASDVSCGKNGLCNTAAGPD